MSRGHWEIAFFLFFLNSFFPTHMTVNKIFNSSYFKNIRYEFLDLACSFTFMSGEKLAFPTLRRMYFFFVFIDWVILEFSYTSKYHENTFLLFWCCGILMFKLINVITISVLMFLQYPEADTYDLVISKM